MRVDVPSTRACPASVSGGPDPTDRRPAAHLEPDRRIPRRPPHDRPRIRHRGPRRRRLGQGPPRRPDRPLRRGRRRHDRLRAEPPARARSAGTGRASSPTGSAATSPPRGLREAASESGIGPDTTIVLYGDNNNWFAAWAYWQLKLFGHQRRPDPQRRPQVLARQRPAADHRRAVLRRRPATSCPSRTSRCAPSATTSCRGSATPSWPSSTSAARPSSTARSSPRPA